MTVQSYSEFLAKKAIMDPATGIDYAVGLPFVMMPHQRDITSWALRRGRAAIFAGTGLGKTLMELSWADKVAAHTEKPVLIFAPLAVSVQHVREAEKFGLTAQIAEKQADVSGPVIVTNYQKIDHFDLSQFGGVVLDESSILKNTDGKYRTRLIEECHQVPFRLAATATPAPNDFMELGNHAEFLGVMSQTDMLAMFFAHDGGETQKWRLKGHAEDAFWKWMASWAVMLRKPADLGYPNDGYDLPSLNQFQHTVNAAFEPTIDAGSLFAIEARTMGERLSARRSSISDRVKMAVDIVISNIGDKLAECHGSQNTQNADETAQKKTLITGQSGIANPRLIRTGGPNTCENITAATQRNLNELRSSERKITSAVGSDTQTTLNIESVQSPSPGGEHQTSEGHSSLRGSTTSHQKHMTNCCEAKAECAQSVTDATNQEDSTLTIATKAATSEDCCAPRATLELAISKTTQIDFQEQSNTSKRQDYWVVWCHLNSEQEALEKAFGKLAISIHGGHDDEQKIARHEAWLRGDAPILIVKPSMFGHGLNWQHCSNCIFVGLSDSFEQVYQAIRRFWRFGQTKPVNVHFIAAETEGAVVANIKRKETDAERMADAMVRHMADLSSANVRGMVRDRADYSPAVGMRLPSFIAP